MMNKCLLLVKVQLLNLFGINKLIHTNEKKEKLKMFFMGLAMFLVVLIMLAYSCGIAIGGKTIGITNVLPPLMLMLSSMGSLIFTFIKSNGLIFGIRDYDMVMSLPVKPSTVIISRLFTVYFMNLLITIIAMVPSIIVYGTDVGVSLSVWIIMWTSIFIAPLIPMIIAMILGSVITAVSSGFKHKSILTIVLSIGAILLIMPATLTLDGSTNSYIIALGNEAAKMINETYPPAAWFLDAVSNNNIGSYMIFVLVSVLGMIIFLGILSKFYSKINAAMVSHRSHNDYKVGNLKSATQFKALYLKEVRRLFSCSIYLLNSCICIILLVFGSIALLFMNPQRVISQISGVESINHILQVVPLIVSVVVTMSSTASVSLSMEGKNRWIIYSSPVSMKNIFNAKIATNLTILIPSVIIISTSLSFSLKTGIVETLLMFIVPIVYSFFTGVVGIICNLKLPKYDWTSEYYAVKQSASVLVSMLVGVVSTLIPIGITIVFVEYATIIMTITAIIVGIVTLILHKKICKVKPFM